jgi:hypothetical protein
MANDGHVAQLKKGVGAWHAWRRENGDIRPDLSWAADLTKANLHKGGPQRGGPQRGAAQLGRPQRGGPH